VEPLRTALGRLFLAVDTDRANPQKSMGQTVSGAGAGAAECAGGGDGGGVRAWEQQNMVRIVVVLALPYLLHAFLLTCIHQQRNKDPSLPQAFPPPCNHQQKNRGQKNMGSSLPWAFPRACNRHQKDKDPFLLQAFPQKMDIEMMARVAELDGNTPWAAFEDKKQKNDANRRWV